MDRAFEDILALEDEEATEDWYCVWGGWLRLQAYYEQERE